MFQKGQMPVGLHGGGGGGTWAVLELTDTLPPFARCSLTVLIHTFYLVQLRVKFLL